MEFVDFLLGEPAQTYFAQQIKEYPVSAGVEPVGDLPPMESLDPPDVDLGNLNDLEGTLEAAAVRPTFCRNDGYGSRSKSRQITCATK